VYNCFMLAFKQCKVRFFVSMCQSHEMLIELVGFFPQLDGQDHTFICSITCQQFFLSLTQCCVPLDTNVIWHGSVCF
jgi:hypothetical protein